MAGAYSCLMYSLTMRFGAKGGATVLMFDNVQPASWNAIKIALVEQRDNLLSGGRKSCSASSEHLVIAYRFPSRQWLDAPAVRAVVAFLPPSVQDAEVNDSIERGLWPLVPLCFEWCTRGSVQPHRRLNEIL